MGIGAGARERERAGEVRGNGGGHAAGRAMDLSRCATEPIHIPGAIQPHGVLFGLDAAGARIRFASENAERLLALRGAPSGRTVADVLGDDAAAHIADAVRAADTAPSIRVDAGGVAWDGVVHTGAAHPIVELEAADGGGPLSAADLYAQVRAALSRLQGARTLDALHATMAEEIRRLSGMDRVMVYRFDPDWNGEVVAESAAEGMDRYLGLRFPASDIPAQARELYRRNWVRLIADVDYVPARLVPPLDPGTGEPIDLSACALRSVSPVHLRYLRNMKVAASMSVSLLRRGELWGLVACHHPQPRRLSRAVRTACEFLGQTFSVQLGTLAEEGGREYALELARTEGRLLERLTRADDWLAALADGEPSLEATVGAGGAALRLRDELVLSGTTPERSHIEALAAWLTRGGEETLATDHLVGLYPDASRFTPVASGLLAMALRPGGSDWLMWFRPEVIRTVRWAGDPAKPVEASDDAPLHPRRSFATYAETVRERARPWTEVEIAAASTVRGRLVDIVLRQAEETARLNEGLRASNEELDAFAWIAGHDLKEPLRGMRTYARVLRDEANLDDLHGAHADRLIQLGDRMEVMLESLLEYARAGNLDLVTRPVDLNGLVSDVLETLHVRVAGSGVETRVAADLPMIRCDPVRTASVYQNLISNALKYRSAEDARVEIGWIAGEDEVPVLYVRDNGIGIDRDNWDAIFDLFRRLHPQSRFGGGAGAGLTIARRLVERHGGRLWLESEPGRGTTFFFTLGRAFSG